MVRGLLLLLNMTGAPRLVFRLMMDNRVPFWLKLILPAALLYLISPIDLIRDMVPVLGFADDAIVILGSLALFLGMAPRDIVLEHLGRGQAGSTERGRTRDAKRKIIDGSYRFADDEDEETEGRKS